MTNMIKFLLVTLAISSLLLMNVLSLPTPFPDESSQLTRRALPKDAKLINRRSVLTYYFLAFEADQKPGPTVTIRTCNKKPLAKVLRSFAEQMKTEGTGRAKNGKVYNFDDCSCGKGFDCFIELDNKKFPFGIRSEGDALAPFTSVAANDIKSGTTIYVPQFDGVILPRGERHNGCLKVQDEGFGFGGKHIDWFVAKESNFEKLDKKLNLSKIDIFSAKCNILKYKD